MYLSSLWFINSLYLACVPNLQRTNALCSFSRSPGPLLPHFPPGPHMCICSCPHQSLYPAGFLLFRRRQSPELLIVRLILRSVILTSSADLSFSDAEVCVRVTPTHMCVCVHMYVHTCNLSSHHSPKQDTVISERDPNSVVIKRTKHFPVIWVTILDKDLDVWEIV